MRGATKSNGADKKASNTLVSPLPPTSNQTTLKLEIEQRIANFIDMMRPYDAFGHVPRTTYSMPMVMLLGNHSAGKSTFINCLLGIEEQETGVAPTDDGFTVLMRGDVNVDADGPTAVSTTQYQFQDLGQYGPNFKNHFRLKTRDLPSSSAFPHGVMIVDTPGMIDTPVHVEDRTTLEGQNRGYDFLAVTRWFAQRADVILLMFDPANPGTTGETLDVLTKSLTGFEHKFLILMNKVDMFDKVTDFARTYGTICWNLSKVMKMKDIPRIYTTFTPLPGVNISEDGQLLSGKNGSGVPLNEMDRARRDVLDEVLKAPLRRLDNLISEVDDACKRVILSAKVSTVLQRRARNRSWLVHGALILGSVAPAVICAKFLKFNNDKMIKVGIASLCSSIIGFAYARKYLVEFEQHCIRHIDHVLRELYPGKKRTVDVEVRWEQSVKPSIIDYIDSHCRSGAGLAALPTINTKKIEEFSAVEVPSVRESVVIFKENAVKELRQ